MQFIACPSCSRLVFPRETACPFCGAGFSRRTGRAAKVAAGALAGATVFVTGIGCAYGCPDCGPKDSGFYKPDVSVYVDSGEDSAADAGADTEVEAAADAELDAPSDADDAAAD